MKFDETKGEVVAKYLGAICLGGSLGILLNRVIIYLLTDHDIPNQYNSGPEVAGVVWFIIPLLLMFSFGSIVGPMVERNESKTKRRLILGSPFLLTVLFWTLVYGAIVLFSENPP